MFVNIFVLVLPLLVNIGNVKKKEPVLLSLTVLLQCSHDYVATILRVFKNCESIYQRNPIHPTQMFFSSYPNNPFT